ncbi:hypothetical protein KXQ82_12795 [Mucilaginibacter sp. HMF5004]|uniref:DUF6265 family protein n=1 Tax=Mucilaginibacter rivuli TaxID=2857527 RepID=UPI001C5D616B|nr:DUF6265 family protein [Mucilaginibacter rivuli]MBW4890606.1 hypothetical protein [Mucilaginibacter rivuli]
MKKAAVFIALLVCIFIYVQQTTTFSSFYLLEGGTWQMKTRKGYICERWKKISKNEMQGQGFRITGTDTLMEEKVQLIQQDDSIYYIPTVNNQNDGKAVSFKLVSSINNEFIFSNPTHDFPQRVVYKLVSQDSVHAWIDGQINGKLVKQDFYYKRVK